MSTNEKVAFIESHKPKLQAGEYTIQATQEVCNNGATVLTGQQSKTIYVAAERFKINQTDVVQAFPPPGNRGNYHNVLPHICLKGSTFPWERHSGQTGLPWLWLFVYDEEDVKAGNVIPQVPMPLNKAFVKVAANTTTNTATGQIEGLPDTSGLNTPLKTIPIVSEPGETESGALKTTPVNIIQLNTDWLSGGTGATAVDPMMPSVTDLPLMTSVRKNSDPTAANPTDSVVEHAICMANRMPKAGVKSYACLLSLEDRLTLDGSTPAYQQYGVDGTMSSFVCLYQWSFQCLGDQSYEVTKKGFKKLTANTAIPADVVSQISAIPPAGLYTSPEAFQTALEAASSNFKSASSTVQTDVMNCFQVPDETFEGFMTHLSVDTFGFDELDPATPGTHNAAINQYLQRGASAFTHHLNTGDKTISWYHGPFRSDNTAASTTIPTGLQSSDQLLHLDTGLNMLDTSYAAAWELGRLLTLKNKSVAMDLYAWRRQQSWKANRSSSRYASALQPQVSENIISKEQQAVQNWIDGLIDLSKVPFNYLVPDERLLPEESIRFFIIDLNWVNCLLDGAMSIGRTSLTTQEVEADLMTQFNLPLTDTNAYSGFLLRSEAVSGWPHLLADPTMKSGTGNKVAEVNLSTDTLLFLFEGEIKSVDIHLKPEGLHFGLNVPDVGDASGYSKNVRFAFSRDTANTLELDATLIQPVASQPVISTIPYSNQAEKVVDVSTLSGNLKTQSESFKTTVNPTGASTTAPFTSAEFAMEMVLPQAHINFAVGTPAASAKYLEDDSKFAGTFVTNSDLFSSGALSSVNPNYSAGTNDDALGNSFINLDGQDPGGAANTLGGEDKGEAQDQAIEAIIKELLAGGAAFVEKLMEEAAKNGITTPAANADTNNPSAQQQMVEEVVIKIIEKGGEALLGQLMKNVLEANSKPAQDPAPKAKPKDQGDPPTKHDSQPKPVDNDPPVTKPVIQATQQPVAANTGLDTSETTGKPVDQLLEGILSKLKVVKDTLKGDAEHLVDEVKEKAEQVKADGERVIDKVKEGVEHAESEVKDKVEGAVDDIESVPEKVKAYLSSVKSDVALTEAGLKIMADMLVTRIKTKVHDDVDKVKDKASQLAEGILGHIHSAEQDFAGKAKDVVTDVKTGIHDGIEKVIDEVHLVESKAEDLRSDIADHIKNIEGDVVNAAKNTLTKVEGKVRSKVAELKAEEHLAKEKEAQLLDDITDKIHEVKHAITQKISDIKEGAVQDESDVLNEAHALIKEVETRVKTLKTNLKSAVVSKFKELEQEAVGYFRSPFDKVKQDVEEVKSKVHEDAENVKADIAKDIQWLKARKTLVWIVLGLLVISIGTWIYRTAFGGSEPVPLLSHFEGVKQMDEIEFIKQHYDETVPVTDKDGQLEFLLSVPATVSGKMDMTQLTYELDRDSLLKITLPPVILSDVDVDLQNVTSYDDRGKSVKLFLSGGGKAYGKAYESIINAVEEVKKGVLSNAIKNDLMEETRRSARMYLLHMANSVGYRVEFIETKPSASFEKDIEDRVGKQLWEQLKHKVQKVDPVDKPTDQSTAADNRPETRREAREDKREDR